MGFDSDSERPFGDKSQFRMQLRHATRRTLVRVNCLFDEAQIVSIDAIAHGLLSVCESTVRERSISRHLRVGESTSGIKSSDLLESTWTVGEGIIYEFSPIDEYSA